MKTPARFYCLCMSPAIDATVTLPAPPRGEGEIFKDVREETAVGGKTVNVARWLALRGADVRCGGLLGEENDAGFVRELARCGIGDCFLRVPGTTRLNEMVVWPGGAVKMNRAAFPDLDAAADALRPERVLGQLLPDDGGAADVVILSGSLPARCPPDFYARAVALCRARGFLTVLDASGEAMRRGLAAGPDLIKPNAEECVPLIGFQPKTPADFRRASALLRERAAHVVISDGAAGAWFDGTFVPAPAVAVVDTTAAGDTLLAEYCWRLFGAGAAAEEAAVWAVAAGSAACTRPGGLPPPPETVAKLKGCHETL